MAKQTIIDWQKDSLLIAHGSGRGGKFALDAVALQQIGEDADGKLVASAQALQAGVEQLGLKGDVTVVASREMVEVRTLAVPKIDADELPDVIRFQAQRQLSNMTDSWALDYVMLPPTPGQEMQTALVGGISPSHMAEIEKACTAAGLQLTRIVLRPIEIARYAVETGSLSPSGTSMIVCVAEQSADLLILRGGQVLQVRNTRLPSEIEGTASVLKGEIRRSLMAASAQLGDAPLEGVLLLSTQAIADHLESVVADASSAPVTHMDPTAMLPAQLAEREAIANRSAHRLAAVAGALSAEHAPTHLLIDFKNPKKRPPKKKNTGRMLLYGGAAAVLLLGGIFWWVAKNRALDQEIADYRAQTAEKAEVVEWSKEKVKDFNEVQEFLVSSPNWLDELAYISQEIPEAEKVILENPVFSTQPRDGTAIIRVPVRASDSSSIGEFERSLRDEHHVIQGSDPAELPQANDGYKWRVVESITIKGRGWNVFGSTKSDDKTKEPAREDKPESKPENAEQPSTEANAAETEDPPLSEEPAQPVEASSEDSAEPSSEDSAQPSSEDSAQPSSESPAEASSADPANQPDADSAEPAGTQAEPAAEPKSEEAPAATPTGPRT